MSAIRRGPAYQFDLSGGVLCLDFANTVSRGRAPERITDHLASYADLVAFAGQSKIISPEGANDLLAYARQHGAEATRCFRKAISFRESLYRAFSASAAGRPAAAKDVEQIDDAAREALQHRKLAHANGGYRWEFDWNGRKTLDRALWAIAQSAAELLTSDTLNGVRECDAQDCGWLFLDHSRNRSRRWCDMKTCGNRQKARRHYHRARE